MDGDQEGNMDDKDDDNDLVLIINRDTNIVDWKATFG